MSEINKDFNYVFDFGKHKGKTIDQVFLENPKYILWCVKKVEFFEMSNKDVFIIEQKAETMPEPGYLDCAELDTF